METVYRILKEPEYELLKITNSSHNFPLHMHKRICIGKIDYGEKYLNINGQVNKLSKDDFYIIPPFTVHSCFTKENKVDYTILSLENGNKNTKEIINKIFRKSNKKDYILKCINNYCDKTFIENNIISCIIEYIENNYFEKITMKGIAKKLGYSPYYILHLFKEKMGLSLHQFIIHFRLRKAKENNNQKLLDIAINNGFFDESHFIRYFKKYEGITPMKYYKSITKEENI